MKDIDELIKNHKAQEDLRRLLSMTIHDKLPTALRRLDGYQVEDLMEWEEVWDGAPMKQREILLSATFERRKAPNFITEDDYRQL